MSDINAIYQELLEDLCLILGETVRQEEARIQIFLKMVAREVSAQFYEDIGMVVDRDLVITNETDLTTGGTVSRVYLPDLVESVNSMWISDRKVEIVTPEELEATKRQVLGSQYLYGAFRRRKDGRCLLELFPQVSTTNASIAVAYKQRVEDITYIPAIYKNVIIYGVAKHWYCFVETADIQRTSLIKKEYKNYMDELKASQAISGGRIDKQYESDSKQRRVLRRDRNDRDIGY